MFAARSQGGMAKPDEEDKKWEVTNTYFTSIIPTQIDSFKTNLVKKIML
jgi:hypothetical protein